MRNPELCQDRQDVGNPMLGRVIKLACFRTFEHGGNHWDETYELAWSTEDPREEREKDWMGALTGKSKQTLRQKPDGV